MGSFQSWLEQADRVLTGTAVGSHCNLTETDFFMRSRPFRLSDQRTQLLWRYPEGGLYLGESTARTRTRWGRRSHDMQDIEMHLTHCYGRLLGIDPDYGH